MKDVIVGAKERAVGNLGFEGGAILANGAHLMKE